jgi:hypothetical protein
MESIATVEGEPIITPYGSVKKKIKLAYLLPVK